MVEGSGDQGNQDRGTDCGGDDRNGLRVGRGTLADGGKRFCAGGDPLSAHKRGRPAGGGQMGAVEKLLTVARAEVGYLEKASNSGLNSKTDNAGYNNYTKYAAELDKLGDIYNGPKNGYHWCDVFVDWCFIRAFGKDLGVKMLYQPLKGLGAGCTFSAQYFQQHGAFFKNPQPGDQIFFAYGDDGYDHTGIVTKVANDRVYTIEGNTSCDSGLIDNGGGVFEKSYPFGYYLIGGYGRPNYKLYKEEKKEMRYNEISQMPAWAQPTIRKLCDKGYLSGNSSKKDELGYPSDLDLSLEMIRCFVVNDKAGLYD